jgi:hypothetical protein
VPDVSTFGFLVDVVEAVLGAPAAEGGVGGFSVEGVFGEG